MVSDNLIVFGIFQEELKNRFLCRVSIDGLDTICYIPSSCRLSNFISLTGKTVMLKRTLSPKSRTKFSVYAVKVGKQFVPVNLAGTNKVLENNLKQRRFSFLGKRNIISHEEVISGYKTDLYISDTRTVIEIKSILSFEKTAAFPTVFSERAIKQLSELERLLHEGYKVCYLLVSMNSSVKEIVISDQNKEFFSKMHQLLELGMLCSGFSLIMQSGEIKINRQIPVSFVTR